MRFWVNRPHNNIPYLAGCAGLSSIIFHSRFPNEIRIVNHLHSAILRHLGTMTFSHHRSRCIIRSVALLHMRAANVRSYHHLHSLHRLHRRSLFHPGPLRQPLVHRADDASYTGAMLREPGEGWWRRCRQTSSPLRRWRLVRQDWRHGCNHGDSRDWLRSNHL